ncbi:hypothetical protein WI29_33990 [Burkholderia ubonensis]|nr:hypothetical protein WI31_15535 [Burkholderia ubonensis]KUZ07376.1 hypothetical protein WI29_33990 [Burkholderia ubonensis]KUZ20617.1 hypothetical protein WI30_01180 [Burkholderia ubonensis]KUZ33389.1 hypothetical protein WI32_19870 [Burkholderia ubonensis]KUZ44808.1 hypothetical protein WI33_28095 [Burkholderia ubonensis]
MNNPLGQYGQQSLFGGLAANTQYAPGYQNAANIAGMGYANAGSALADLGNFDLATQRQLLGAGRQVFDMGLDPQSALYDRTLNQLTQQTGATNSMYGLGSSAAGAGVQNQALSNFNIDWQNNQLSRALQGLQGYTGAASTGGQYGQAGANALTLSPQYTLAGGSTPYTTAQAIAATPGQLGNTYGAYLNQNVYGPAEGIMGQIIPYMNYGQGAQAVPYQNSQNNAAAWGGAVGNGVQTALGSSGVQNVFSNFFNPASGSFSGGDFSGAFTSSPYYSGGGNSWGFTTA